MFALNPEPIKHGVTPGGTAPKNLFDENTIKKFLGADRAAGPSLKMVLGSRLFILFVCFFYCRKQRIFYVFACLWLRFGLFCATTRFYIDFVTS